MPNLRSIDGSNVDEILHALDQDGACIALNLLANATCDQLLRDFGPHLQALELGTDELGYREQFYGNKTKRLHGLFSKSPAMESVLTHPLLLALVDRQFVQPGLASAVRLSNAELMVLHQGQEQQMFHSDAASWRHAQQIETQELLLSANYALTDFTAENGATCVVPGSHRWEPGRDPLPGETCLAIMPRGSALLYVGNVLHAGGANRTQQARTGLYMGYVVSWLRPLENQLITNASEDIFSLSSQAQQLLDVSPAGFTVYA
ncbi:MAG: phytanoyl-CoA dioxygenase family protein [Pseudomonadales bacterium]